MDNKRENVSLWLHNKLGTSNDSWISSSISSQLNKDVLKQIKDCFPDLQTQVKIKFLLAFFHIPRRLVEEWKTELEEIIEVATSDTELWVSMTAETMKTFPLTGSLNTEISDYEETRPIFTDMVNDLKKLVNKHHDIGMLPLECQYLNKSALVSVVGQQPGPTKHFTLKKKPKSATLRAELLQKCSDAQSTLKKSSAPTVPLRSRGMPRKMADTTPMRGIPSRVPTSGFRSPPPSTTPKSLNRTPAGRKEGGVKLLDIADQPLGYAQAKKRKRQQELEEQQRKALEAQSQQQQQQNNGATPAVSTPSTTTPDYAAGLTASSVYSQPATPMPSSSAANQTTIKEIQSSTPNTSTSILTPNNHIVVQSNVPVATTLAPPQPVVVQQPQQQQQINSPTQQTVTVVSSPPAKTTTLPSNIQIVRSVSYNPPGTQQILTPTTTIGPPPPSVEIVRKTVPTSSIQQSYTKILGNSNIILTQKPIQQPTISVQQSPAQTQPITSYTIVKQPVGQTQMRVVAVSSAPSSNITLPTLTTTLPRTTQIIQQQQQPGQTPTKIVQIKTAPTIPTMMVASSQANSISNIPPLIPTHQQQQPQLVNIQNMHHLTNQQQRKAVTITTQNQPTSNIILQQQQPQQTQIQQTIQQNPQTIITGGAGNQAKYAQVVMSPNVKGKTIILTNPNLLSGQKNVILRSGNTVYQLGNVQGLQNLNVGGTTTLMTTGPPGLIKTENPGQTQGTTQQIPALVPTNQQMPSLTPVVYANQQQKSIPTLITNLQTQQGNHLQHQTQTQGQTIIRPVLTSGGQLPQGLTLIQRPGQQPQLVQTIQQTQTQPTQIGRTIITAQPQQKTTTIQQQPQILQYKKVPQQTTIQLQQVPQQQQQQTIQQQQQVVQARKQGKGLSLSSKHVTEAHDMFKRANRVTRLDKALILGFMAGYRDNPRPNPENVVEIKLNESEENVKQGDDIIPMIVETLIHLDYNTGEWKTFNRCLPPKSGQEQQVPNAQSVSAS